MRYPRVAHLFGSAVREGDVSLSEAATARVLRRSLAVYEKLDGLNVGFRFRGPGRLVILSRVHGELFPHQLGEELAPLASWAMRRLPRLWALCRGTADVAFGEWLLPRIGLRYPKLPDAVAFFDLCDRGGRWCPRVEMERRVKLAGLLSCPKVAVLRPKSLAALLSLKAPVPFGAHRREGYVLCDGPRRYKLVLPTHRRLPSRLLGKRWNRLSGERDAPCLV